MSWLILCLIIYSIFHAITATIEAQIISRLDNLNDFICDLFSEIFDISVPQSPVNEYDPSTSKFAYLSMQQQQYQHIIKNKRNLMEENEWLGKSFLSYLLLCIAGHHSLMGFRRVFEQQHYHVSDHKTTTWKRTRWNQWKAFISSWTSREQETSFGIVINFLEISAYYYQ